MVGKVSCKQGIVQLSTAIGHESLSWVITIPLVTTRNGWLAKPTRGMHSVLERTGPGQALCTQGSELPLSVYLGGWGYYPRGGRRAVLCTASSIMVRKRQYGARRHRRHHKDPDLKKQKISPSQPTKIAIIASLNRKYDIPEHLD